ncbi:MAG TPA: hypothetical protein VGM78_13675 [Ilumatobacteraceae bacterium]|jgi:hypothetical protein
MARRTTATVVVATLAFGCALLTVASGVHAVPRSTAPTDTAPTDTAPTDTGPTDTASNGSVPPDAGDSGATETGANEPLPAASQSEPLVQFPPGCEKPPVATVVFVGTMIAKDYRIARFQVEQIRAGDASHYISSGLIDIRYDNETQFLSTNTRYLVGAATDGASSVLVSKVRPSKPLFGGNAVIGLTEKNQQCPTVQDPIRTLNLDGSSIPAGLFKALGGKKRAIVLAFAKPIAAVIAIVLALAAVRWLFAAIFVTVGRAADGEPLVGRNDGRRRIT